MPQFYIKLTINYLRLQHKTEKDVQAVNVGHITQVIGRSTFVRFVAVNVGHLIPLIKAHKECSVLHVIVDVVLAIDHQV